VDVEARASARKLGERRGLIATGSKDAGADVKVRQRARVRETAVVARRDRWRGCEPASASSEIGDQSTTETQLLEGYGPTSTMAGKMERRWDGAGMSGSKK
jgi:hypothetical protein